MKHLLLSLIALLLACAQPGPGATVSAKARLDNIPEISNASLLIMPYSQPPWHADHGQTYATPWPAPEYHDVSATLGDLEEDQYVLDLTFTNEYTPIMITGGITYDGEDYDWCHVLGWDDQYWYDDDDDDVAMAAEINQVASLSIEADLPDWGVARNYDADATDGLPFCSILVVADPQEEL